MVTTLSNIYSFIINATVIVLGIIITLISLLIPYLLFDNQLLYIPFLIGGIVISIVVGSHLFVVLSIPFQLPKRFDPIKNKVALGEYSSIEEFQLDIANFMVSFFNFAGADIVGGKFHFTNCEHIIIECGVNFDNLTKQDFKNKNSKKIDSNYKAFHLPIKLGNKNLGYMILITKGFTLPILYSILEDFENYYLDDQIVSVMRLPNR